MLKHYIEFLYIGPSTIDASVREVKDRDHTKIEAPKDCFGFRFYDRTEGMVDGEWAVGLTKNYSGVYLSEGIKSLLDLKVDIPESALKSMMECKRFSVR